MPLIAIIGSVEGMDIIIHDACESTLSFEPYSECSVLKHNLLLLNWN